MKNRILNKIVPITATLPVPYMIKNVVNNEIYDDAVKRCFESIDKVGGFGYSIDNNYNIVYFMNGENIMNPFTDHEEYINKIDFSPVYNLYNSGIFYGLAYKVLSSILYLFNKKKNKDLDKLGFASAISGGIVDASYGMSLYRLPIKIWGEPLEKYIIENPNEAKNITGLITAQKVAFIGGVMVDVALAGYGLWRIMKNKRVGAVDDYKGLAEVLKKVE